MNRRPQGSSGNHRSPGSSDCAVRSNSLPLSKALVGFTNARLAEGLSPRTVNSYPDDLQKWVERAGDREIGEVSGPQIRAYLAWLRTEYQPQRCGGKTTLSLGKPSATCGSRLRPSVTGPNANSPSRVP